MGVSRTIYIAGAGIAGLTLALGLAKFGLNVVVLERNAGVSEFGAGLQISPNARKVLDRLGLEAAIAEKSPARPPVSKFVIKSSPCYIGLNKDEPKLLAKLNEIIAKAKSSGELAKISERWLKAPLPADL